MTELEALRRVAEAARELDRWPHGVPGNGAIVDRDALAAVWRALDTLPASPAPETVTLAVWATSDGAVALVTPGTRCDHPDHPLDRRLGTVTLPLAEGGA